MHRLPAILVACCLQIGLQANEVKLSSLPYWIDGEGNTNALTVVPFLLVTGVDTNGQAIYEAPPAWMLQGDPGPQMRFCFTMQTSTNLVDWGFEHLTLETPATNQTKFYNLNTLEVAP